MDRRDFLSHACRLILTTGVGLSALETILVSEAEAAPKKMPPPKSPAPPKSASKPTAKFHIPESPPMYYSRTYVPPQSGEYRARIERATLEFLHDRWDKQSWNGRNIGEVNIEERVHWILYWTMKGVQEAAAIFPVDPLLLIAQMHEESRFYEFAISPAAAAGVAQFIKPSAKSYGMVCAGTTNTQGCAMPEHAGAYERFLKIRSERAHAERVIKDIEDVPESYLDLKEMSKQEQEALRNYRRFLRANVNDRDILDKKDRRFLEGFDQRFGYRYSIPAMARYMAQNLAECDGKVFTATIGYNAGMGWVRKKKCGIPIIGESIKYSDKIVATYRAIARRANG